MAGPNNTPQLPGTPDNSPGFPDESAQWAALETELEQDKTVFEQEAPDGPTPPPPRPPSPPDNKLPQPQLKSGDPEPPLPDGTPKPRPTYEQLELNQRNTTEALRLEREARKRADEHVSNINRMVEELRAARGQPRPPEPPKPVELPDVNEDPIAHFQARTQMLEQALAATYQGQRQTAEHMQAQQAEAQFWSHVQAHEAEFRKTAPTITADDGRKISDYDMACEHLKAHRIGELQHLYPDDSQIAQHEARQYGLPSVGHLRAAMLQQDAIAIAQRAFQLGVSPALLYYQAAQTRGYKTPEGQPAANGKGRTNPQIEASRRGQRAALTISGGEGRKSSADMTISDLSDLWADDPDEFDKQWDRMKAAGKL